MAWTVSVSGLFRPGDDVSRLAPSWSTHRSCLMFSAAVRVRQNASAGPHAPDWFLVALLTSPMWRRCSGLCPVLCPVLQRGQLWVSWLRPPRSSCAQMAFRSRDGLVVNISRCRSVCEGLAVMLTLRAVAGACVIVSEVHACACWRALHISGMRTQTWRRKGPSLCALAVVQASVVTLRQCGF